MEEKLEGTKQFGAIKFWREHIVERQPLGGVTGGMCV